MNKSKLWIDVTDFLNWTGHFTGIQRIQYNLALQYIDSGRSVGFFVYKEGARCFEEVAFNPKSVAKNGLIDSHLQVNGRVGSKATPARFRKIAKKVWNATQVAAPVAGAQSPFLKDDVVLVLGGIWYGEFINDLVEEKKSKKFKFVHFIHDMIPVVVPGFVVESLPEVFRAYKEVVFTNADGLIANSQNTARDARSFMRKEHINEPRITVVRIGDERIMEGSEEEPVAQLAGKDFIICVGTVEGRKNHALLFYVIKAAHALKLRLPTIVMVGRDGWLTENVRYMLTHDPDAKETSVLLNNVSDGQLAWLYRNCRLSIYPSFYEGWGMPVAESLAYGKVCLSSNSSSMPEIGGDLVDYFPPYDPMKCLELIQKYMKKQELTHRENVIKKGYKISDWNSMYGKINEFLNTL